MTTKIIFYSFLFAFSFFACTNDSPKESFPPAILTKTKTLIAGQVIDRIKKEVNCEWRTKTVDTFKSGDPSQKVSGIATTFLANMEVLKKAKGLGANLIITHEPTYYNHHDDTEPYEQDQVYLDKKKYIEDNGLIIWRFHDHWHYTNPDGIHKGMVDHLGWRKYQTKSDQLIFELPETSVEDLARQLSQHYQSSAIRVVGDANMKSGKVGLVVGAPGSMRHIEMMQTGEVEVLIIGEVNEWETVEYIRDGIGQGKKMALILLGHVNSEEAGMSYCKDWLETFISEVPITHIPSGDPFWVPK